jgi:1-acyl-sn-glycerol-3-phosphate acyltransferase
MIALRSLVYNALFYVNIVVLMILGLPVVLFGRRGVFALARLWGAISLWLLDKVCGLRVEFRGLEHRPRGGVIVAAKHESFLETFALLKYAPDFAIILKRQLLFIPFFGQYLVAAQQIAIDRSRGRRALTQISAAARPVIGGGRQIIIYPEGTRRMPGAPPRYKFGVTALYLDTGAPCHPVALNTGLFWGRRGFRRRPGVAIIEFLPPIEPGLERIVFSARLQQAIEEGCERLCAEAIARDPSLAAVLAEGRLSEATGAEGDLPESD